MHELNCLFSSLTDYLGSKIIGDDSDYIQKFKEYLQPVQASDTKWKLCFRASENSYSASAFHAACDNKGPTVTLVQVGDNVFGGYTDKSWDEDVQGES